jgi:glyoxylase-like metal-dependent hydrolase (beta-lactamase superfamily II)
MPTTSRRDVILSAAVAGAALGLDKSLAIVAPVEGQQTPAAPARSQHRPPAPVRRAQTPDPRPGFLRYKVGDAEVTALYDGIWEKVHDPGCFSNATVAETKQALADAGLTTAFVPIPITVFVIKLRGKLVLCDAGGGNQVQALNPKSVFVSGKMMANMRAAGIDPKKIETILISHFHPDHIFGLLEKNSNAPVFPNAEIIVPAAEYKWWTDPSLITRLPTGRRPLARRIQTVIPNWKNVLPVEGEDEVVPGIRFVSAPGHTPGHTAFHISSGNEQLMISSDAAYVPALCAVHPGWHGVFDQNAVAAEASRRKLLDRVIADKMMICGSHFPWPGLGKIARDGAGYALTTVQTA